MAVAIEHGYGSAPVPWRVTRSDSRPRHYAGAAVLRGGLLAVALLLAACSPSPSPAVGSGSPDVQSSASAGALPGSSASADRLATALAAMGNGYTYTAIITVGSKTISSATGRSVGGAGEFVLKTGGKSVTYRAIPPKAWAKKTGAAWVVVSGKLPVVSPLAGLAKSTGSTVVSDAADQLVLDVTYPPSALGLTGSTAVTVRLSLAASGAITATYETTVGSDAASSTSVFTPAASLKPIVAP